MKWLHLKTLILFPVIGLISLLVNCSFPGDSNGSGVGNGMICGKLYEPDGVTPAVNAVVTLWERSENSSSQLQPSTAVLQTRTDEEGKYSIVRIGPGSYAIEALDDLNNIVIIDSIFIPNEWTSPDSLTDTLKAPGAISGYYDNDFSAYPPIKPSINLCGTYWSIHPISNGTFFIAPLAEGFYLLQTIDGQKFQVWVSSGDTTDVKIEVLEKLPVVDKIGILYDSSKHSTIVNWKVVKASILGCNLYRRIAGDSSFGQPLNGSELIHDTMFVDTTAFPGSEYQYTVAAVDSVHRTGPLSEIVSTSTYDIVVDLDTLTRLIELGWSRIGNYCFFIQSRDPKSINLAIGPPIVSSWQIQKYDAADGSLISSSLTTMPDYAGGGIKTAGDQIFYQKRLDTTIFATAIVCMDKTGNERTLETFTSGSFLNLDVRGNTIAFARGTGWNKQDSSANNYSITRSLTTDGMVVYSIKIGPVSYFEFRDVRICADSTLTLFFIDHILKLDASGKEIATIKLPPKPQTIYECFYKYSDMLYMMCNTFRDSNGEIIHEFSVYNFSNVLLYKVKLRAVTSLDPIYLATNGDIYLQTYDKVTEKAIIYHLPNPLHNDR